MTQVPATNGMNYSQMRDALEACLKSRMVPFMKGSPGIGKSAMVAELADKYNLKLIDFRLSQADPTDLNGFPFPNEQTGRASYIPMDIFPIEGDELPFNGRMEDDPANPGQQRLVQATNAKTGVTEPERYAGWLLFLDEFNSASLAVQKATYKLTLDHMVGQHKLHPRVMKICAGNLDTDNAITSKLSTAMQSRLIHLNLITDSNEWLNWAATNGVDYRITSFIHYKPELLNAFKPDHTDVTFPCQRTWEFVHNFLTNIPTLDHQHMNLISGAIGQGAAMEFIGFTKVFNDLPTIDEILKTPSSAKIPTSPDCQYAVTGLLSNNANGQNIKSLMTYINRIPKEFVVITLKDAIRRTPELMQNEEITKWMEDNLDLIG